MAGITHTRDAGIFFDILTIPSTTTTDHPMIEELLKQKAQIEAQIAAHRSQEREAAIKTVRQLITTHGLTSADIGGPTTRAKLLTATVRVKADKRVSVTPKFRGPNGELWSGRGLQPRWLRDAIGSGASLEQFRIAA